MPFEENGDYQTIAHISSEGEIRYYVDGLPDDVVSRIEQAAAREQQKALFSAAYKVGDRVYLDGKPFEITRVDDWNVELMDRSVQNPQPRLEQKDSFMRLVQQNERSSFTMLYFGAQPGIEKFYEKNGCKRSLQSYAIEKERS